MKLFLLLFLLLTSFSLAVAEKKGAQEYLGKCLNVRLLFLILKTSTPHTQRRAISVSVPGLCPCVYLYLLVLNESAAHKVYQSRAGSEFSYEQTQQRTLCDAATIRADLNSR